MIVNVKTVRDPLILTPKMPKIRVFFSKTLRLHFAKDTNAVQTQRIKNWAVDGQGAL